MLVSVLCIPLCCSDNSFLYVFVLVDFPNPLPVPYTGCITIVDSGWATNRILPIIIFECGQLSLSYQATINHSRETEGLYIRLLPVAAGLLMGIKFIVYIRQGHRARVANILYRDGEFSKQEY